MSMDLTESIAFHRAEEAEASGEGICRTCLEPIWNEGGTVGRTCGRDSLVCFKASGYRHLPLTGREACIYDCAYRLGAEGK